MRFNSDNKPIAEADVLVSSSANIQEASPDFFKIAEQSKGETEEEQNFDMIARKLKVSPHPFNYEFVENVYVNRGSVHGAVDKTVDAVVSGGMKAVSKDPRSQAVIDKFDATVNKNVVLRQHVKDTLLFGTGYIEKVFKNFGKNKNRLADLINWDSKRMFIRRKKGKKEIDAYVQTNSKFKNPVEFAPDKIAHSTWDVLGDAPYGQGMVYPALTESNSESEIELMVKRITKRKANNPYDVTVGSPERPAKSLGNITNKMTHLEERTEFIHNQDVAIKVLDTGNIGEKLDPIINHFSLNRMQALQVPEVLLGRGNIPEGLAKAQLDTFRNERVRAIQEEIEKTWENDIYKPLLESNALPSDVEIIWGQQTREQKLEEIKAITELLKVPFGIDPNLSDALNGKLFELFDIEVEEEKDKEDEENEPQPRVPTVRPGESLHERHHHLTCVWRDSHHGHPYYIGSEEAQEMLESSIRASDNMTIKEWVGFDYSNYENSVVEFLKKYNFNQVSKLTSRQRTKLRKAIITSMQDNESIRQLQRRVNNIGLGDLEVKISKTEMRKAFTLTIPELVRSAMIARTETIRANTEGALINYKQADVQMVEWNAALDERVCPICESLNGQRYTTEEAVGLIPSHGFCRCTFLPIVE